MPDDAALALGRLGRVLGWLEAAPAALDAVNLGRVLRLTTRLWGDLFTAETGLVCAAGLPTKAPSAFAPCPEPGDGAAYQAWHAVQGSLFLHYAPVASRLLGPALPPPERAAALLIADALRLLGDHAAGLRRPYEAYGGATRPAAPFAHLFQRTDRLRSGHSSDVNLGAVALGLAVESGMRHALGVSGEMRLSMSRLFQALAIEARQVRLAVDLPTLVAVYNWAGRHRRAGRRDGGWLNYYAADLLHPLFVSSGPLSFGLEVEPDTLARLKTAATASNGEANPPRASWIATTVPVPSSRAKRGDPQDAAAA